ncbi:unnamed protein product [Absidia cylindrospora]
MNSPCDKDPGHSGYSSTEELTQMDSVLHQEGLGIHQDERLGFDNFDGDISDSSIPPTTSNNTTPPTTSQPLFLNFTSDLSPQKTNRSSNNRKRQTAYRVNGVNILNRNNIDSKTAIERIKKRRENHNYVERRRRDNINNTILELSQIVPNALQPDQKPNKGNILKLTLDYVKKLQAENITLKSNQESDSTLLHQQTHSAPSSPTHYHQQQVIQSTSLPSSPMHHHHHQQQQQPYPRQSSGTDFEQTTLSPSSDTTASSSSKKLLQRRPQRPFYNPSLRPLRPVNSVPVLQPSPGPNPSTTGTSSHYLPYPHLPPPPRMSGSEKMYSGVCRY